MFQTEFVEKRMFYDEIKIHFIFNNDFFLSQIMPLMRMSRNAVETDIQQNMSYAHCMLDNQGHRHALRIRNIYCFSTAKVVARTRLSFTLYVHCLSCLIMETDYVLCEVRTESTYLSRNGSFLWQANLHVILRGYSTWWGRDSLVGTTTRYGLNEPGIESRWEARLKAHAQTDPGAHPPSYTMGTWSFQG
jgi:hypothetical protein